MVLVVINVYENDDIRKIICFYINLSIKDLFISCLFDDNNNNNNNIDDDNNVNELIGNFSWLTSIVIIFIMCIIIS